MPDTTSTQTHHDTSRRSFLSKSGQLAAAGVVAGWLPAFTVNASAQLPAPQNFPSHIRLYKQGFKNWAGDIQVDALWTCSPSSPEQVVQVVNWAKNQNYRVRPRGMMHNWSPLTLSPDQPNGNLIMLDMTQHLTQVSINTRTLPAVVTAQTGIQMEHLLQKLQDVGLGVTACPAPGDLTLGGVLAIDGHGTAVPAKGESRSLGHTYGSFSNLILSMTAVVFDADQNQYVLKTFQRDHHDMQALLVHLGRALITSVTFQAGQNQRLRCISRVDIPAKELFAKDPKAGRTFSSFLDSAGRAEAIWFPFTEHPWLKVWSVCPRRPLFSRPVFKPFNYLFSDRLPSVLTNLIEDIVLHGKGHLTPLFGQTALAISTVGLISTGTKDIWGWSKDLLLYVKPTTLRVTANGYAVQTRRDNVQRVLHDFIEFYRDRIEAYRQLGRYPMNGPIEIRVTGLDQPHEVTRANPQIPALSAVKPCPNNPDWDCAVWFDILTFPNTPYANQFYREIEQWMWQRYRGDSLIRPEWSKGWGYTADAAWQDTQVINHIVPASLSAGGQPAAQHLNASAATLNRLDPYRLFSSPLLDKLLP
ncbi:MAG: cholesterol oxidase substrate-binding domain-containing protein [Pseudomonadota bacterium]|nr:cholesterol oxidase substrate-binding domain-containing protein [Pseudomonadota bacterium]